MGTPFQRPVSPRRPFSSATATLRAASGLPAPDARHGAAFLPELLDFEGAVHLAHTLRSAPAGAVAGRTPNAAVSEARQRLASVERDARQPLRDPMTGAPLVSPERLDRALARAGAPASRSRKALALAGRELFAPVESRALARIASLRRAVAEVRHELGAVIAASGPVAARIEQLDAALASATAARTDALVARAVSAVGDAFAAELERAVIALPKACEEAPVASWLAEGGWVAEHVEQCERLVLASFLHERERVEMLVRSTIDASAEAPA